MPEIIALSSAAQRSLQFTIRRSRFTRPPLHYPRVCSQCISRREASSAAAAQTSSSEYEVEPHQEPSRNSSSLASLSTEQRQFLDSALRVNQAGELAAVLIYAAQNPVLVRKHPNLRSLMQHMYDQEAGHFKTFNELIAKHRIRPTVMYPVWRMAATALGWSTAVIGREAAMACTEAVETEIGEHYNNQVRVLLEWAKELESRGEGFGDEMKDLLATLRRIRDEELEHLDHAVANDAKGATPYDLLTSIIRGGCRSAIWISERI